MNEVLEIPNEAAKKQARAAFPVIDKYDQKARKAHQNPVLILPDGNERVEVPIQAFHLLNFILKNMAEGRGVTITPAEAEVSTQVAARLLNVSRPFLIGLLEEGKIPYYTVGKHRRIRLADVNAFEKQFKRQRTEALDELARLSSEMGLDY
jgi:excisionase family DNA binding protein